jgi:AraC-like DNA-binding protein
VGEELPVEVRDVVEADLEADLGDRAVARHQDRACHLLMAGDRPVTEICFEVGFNNVSNFNRQFSGGGRPGRSAGG